MTNQHLAYDRCAVEHWVKQDKVRWGRDTLTAKCIKSLLLNAPVLELGSGSGQLAQALAMEGVQVVPSDASPDFVAHMQQMGLKAKLLDILVDNVESQQLKYRAILSRGLSPLISMDLKLCAITYQRIYQLLDDNGKFIFIFPRDHSGNFSTLTQHIAHRLWEPFAIAKRFRHQALPGQLYQYLPSRWFMLAEQTLSSVTGISDIVVLAKNR